MVRIVRSGGASSCAIIYISSENDDNFNSIVGEKSECAPNFIPLLFKYAIPLSYFRGLDGTLYRFYVV